MARNTIKFSKKIKIIETATAVGEFECQSPLKRYFDISSPDSRFGMDTWEKAEAEMVRTCSEAAIKKAKKHYEDIDLILAGDLTNQCTASVFGLKDKGIPYLGLYGACSTFALSMGMGAVSIESDLAKTCLCLASSHYCSAERQYRFPLEYGCQRTPTAQCTVTAAGCGILEEGDGSILLTEFLPGRICDYKITDAANMGAAMAPACADTLLRYFRDSDCRPEDFDYILSGDLGAEGCRIVRDLCRSEGLLLGQEYSDCGLMIYDLEKQDVNAGGSGCGCSAAVFCGYIMEMLKNNTVKNVLLLGTGALLSPGTVMQQESIPGVCHLIRIEVV